MIVDELIAVLGYDLRGEANLARFNAGMEKAASIARVMSAAIVAAGAVAAGAMAMLGKSVINTSAEFEGYQTSLETIEGSAGKAKASMDWITNFAAKTPYELAGVTQAFIKLKSYGIDPMDGTLTTLGDTASAMNKPLDMAVEAFADATSFQFERLREFGVTTKQEGDEVVFSWTKNGKSLSKTVKKTGAEVQKFLREHWGQAFNGAMIRQSKTWNGMMSNLGDSWALFQKRIGDAGFFEHVKKSLGGVLDYIGKLDDDGTLDRWATNLSNGLVWAFDGIKAIVTQLALDLSTIGGLLDKAGGKIADFFRWISGGKIDLSNWQAIGAVLGALLAVLNPVWLAMAGLAYAVDDLLTWIRGGKSVIGDLIGQFDQLGPTVQSSVDAVFTAIGSVDWSDLGKRIVNGLIKGVNDAAKSISTMVSSIDWSALGKNLGSSIDFAAIGSAWATGMKTQFEMLKGVRDGLISGLMAVDWSTIGTAWAKAFAAQFLFVDGVMKGIAQQIVTAAKGWFKGVDFKSLGEDIKAGVLKAVTALPAAIVAQFTGKDFTEIGNRMGAGILSGLQSIGEQIKAWFANLLPAWAADFFDWKTAKDGSLKGKATAESERRANFEKDTAPRWGVDPQNFKPGATTAIDPSRPLADQSASADASPVKADNQPAQKVEIVQTDSTVSRQIVAALGGWFSANKPVTAQRMATTDALPGKAADDRIGKLMGALNNFAANSARTSGDGAAKKTTEQVVNDNRQDNRDLSISVNAPVSLRVEQINQAADQAGAAVKQNVSNAAKSVPTPSRVMHGAHF